MEERKIRIACCGDSITYGFGLPAGADYPSLLQEALGPSFEVGNFGLNGSTMQRSASPVWIGQAPARRAMGFMADVVILCLGTNDAFQLGEIDGREFREETLRTLGHLKETAPDARVILCLPPPAWFFEGGMDLGEVICQTHAPLREAGAEAGAKILDLHAPLLAHSDCFFDGVHPAVQGAERIAALVEKAVRGEGF